MTNITTAQEFAMRRLFRELQKSTGAQREYMRNKAVLRRNSCPTVLRANLRRWGIVASRCGIPVMGDIGALAQHPRHSVGTLYSVVKLSHFRDYQGALAVLGGR